jgi:anti-sigma regulatory factor (Ser/Thr protein kinase)
MGKDKVVDVRLERDSRAPIRARRAVEALRPRLKPSTFNDVTLLVSELVTNSVQHAGADRDCWVGVRLSVLPETVRVEVTDPGPGFVHEPGPAPLDQESGRGLYLVGAISDRWGVDTDGFTRVWFEIGASA